MSESSSPDHHGSGEECIGALAIVFSGSRNEFAVTTDDVPTLPEVRVLDRFYPEIEDVVRAVAATLGVEVRVLGCLDLGNLDEGRPRLYSLVMSRRGESLGDGFRWYSSAEVESLGEIDESQIASVRQECERISGDTPELAAVPWEWPGSWGCEARQWICSNLESVTSPEQLTLTPIRSWSISSVIRVDAETGPGPRRFYFKASPTFFSNEVSITDLVADRFPEISPQLVSVDTPRRWMLMEDLGDLTLGAADSIDPWCEAMRALARIQTGFVRHTSQLERLGLERRLTSAVATTLRQWVQSSGSLGLGYESGRTERALERLEPHIELVEELCKKVDGTGLPATLDHGDLDAGNIFVRDGSPVIMDWSDSSISSPLYTAALIPQVSRNPVLMSAFLEEWTEFAPVDQLEEAFDASKPIAALERAFHYHRNIVAHLEYPSVDMRVLESYIPGLLNLAATELERRR